jgi:hypothetical protein
MNRIRLKSSMVWALLLIAFSAGHSLGADCSSHQPSCTYAVFGCVQMSASCQGTNLCWREIGKCCEEDGSEYSQYCGPGCDAGGGGSCGLLL